MQIMLKCNQSNNIDMESPAYLIDGYGFLSGEVLKRAGDKGLGEEEPADPEDWRCRAVLHPVLQECDTLYKKIDQLKHGIIMYGGYIVVSIPSRSVTQAPSGLREG